MSTDAPNTTTTEPGASRNLNDMRAPPSERVAPQNRLAPPSRRPDVAPEAAMPKIRIGFYDMQSWEFTQRVARAFASSSLVPEAYRMMVPAGKWGAAKKQMVENPNAIPNCIIALNMAERLNADPLMVMQNLYIVEGRPAWSAQFVIAAINSCGRFTAIQYELTDDGVKTIEYEESAYSEEEQRKVQIKKKATIPMLTCVASVTDKATGARLESTPITMEMAVLEGWYGRNGSKWQTPMRGQMLRYRAASFLGRLYAPDLLMGLRTVEEETEILEAERDADGAYSVVPPETIDQATEQRRDASPAQLEKDKSVAVDLGLNRTEPEPETVQQRRQEKPQEEVKAKPDPKPRQERKSAQQPAEEERKPVQQDLMGDPRSDGAAADDDSGFGSGE